MFSDVLLTVDYDRTLTDTAAHIPQRNLDAIEYFIENGGTFTVNTGRSLPNCTAILKTVPMNTGLIACNGALIVEDGVPTHLTTIDLPVEDTLQKICRAFPGLNVDLQGLTTHFGFNPQGHWEAFHAAQGAPYQVAAPGTDYGPFLKLNVYGFLAETSMHQMYTGTAEEIALIDEAEKWLREHFGDKLTVIRSQARILNIHAAGVSKLNAARQLQKRLGKKILICVGDEENDRDMLQGADYSFSPSDSPMAALFCPVCPCGEGAVADVICEKIPEILKG